MPRNQRLIAHSFSRWAWTLPAIWILLGLLLVDPGFSQGKHLHPNLSHGREVTRIPKVARLSKYWQSRTARAFAELKGSKEMRTKALDGLLTDLVLLEAKLVKSSGTSERKAAERRDMELAIRYLVGNWKVWIKDKERSWVGTWLTEQALGGAKKPLHRARAMELMVEARHPDAETLLVHQANRVDSPIRLHALRSMSHWPRLSLDRHLVRGLTDSKEDLGWMELLLHRVQAHGPLNKEALGTLPERLKVAIRNADWQIAGRALLLAKGIPPKERLKMLIEVMPSVADGVRSNKLRFRILGDIAAELREITGRAMGTDPRAWQTFYERYKSGDLPLSSSEGKAAEEESRVGFFGIGNVSDHVTFVIDMSGSMESQFQTSGLSAYQAAIKQLIAYLEQAGPDSWFQVVVFSDRAKRVIATEQPDKSTLASVRRALGKRKPGGGTHLGLGVEEALRSNKRESQKSNGHASDTFIILCDGATVENRQWAEELISRPSFPTGLRFYCVQIGSDAAPAMRALAELTGGRFVRI